MPLYTLFNDVTHYSTFDVFDGDCYFICEFTEPVQLDHSDGFSNIHRGLLPTVESDLPTCVGCLQYMIQEMENNKELNILNHTRTTTEIAVDLDSLVHELAVLNLEHGMLKPKELILLKSLLSRVASSLYSLDDFT
jgi:hypothetical protein